jgi:biopolymer transport protein ExbB/TolQ
MTLGHKITLLLSFMGIVTLILFFWFASQMFCHVNNFQSSMAKDELALKAARERSLKKLKEKAGQMGTEISDHFNKMEAELQRMSKEEEAFNENFLNRQNQHFDAVDTFMSQKKRVD